MNNPIPQPQQYMDSEGRINALAWSHAMTDYARRRSEDLDEVADAGPDQSERVADLESENAALRAQVDALLGRTYTRPNG